MRILAGMSLLICVSSLSYSRLEDNQEQRVQLQKRDAPRSLDISILYKIKLRLMDFLSLNPWKNKAFAVWAISLSFIAFGNFIPFVFLVSMFSVFYSLSNTEDRVTPHLQTSRKELQTRLSGLFLGNLDVFGDVVNKFLECLIYLFNRN